MEDLNLKHPWGREVPVRLYGSGDVAKGFILFSVGFGGTRTGYGFLARRWAAAGFPTAVVEHVGSNLEVLKSLPQKRREERNAEVVRRVQDPEELAARPRDLQLVFQTLAPRFEGLPLGLGGHSFGSYSILAAAGLESKAVEQAFEGLPAQSLLAMSPQPPGMLFDSSEFGELASPTLILTGTQDHLLSGGATYEDRLKVYSYLRPEQRALTVLQDVEHMTFAGIGLNLGPQLEAICKLTLLWWEHSFRSGSRGWPEVVAGNLSSEMITTCR